jgi:hypothetical protein
VPDAGEFQAEQAMQAGDAGRMLLLDCFCETDFQRHAHAAAMDMNGFNVSARRHWRTHTLGMVTIADDMGV